MATFTRMQWNRYIRDLDTPEEHVIVEQQIWREMETVAQFFQQYLREHGCSSYFDILDAMPEDLEVIDDIDIILQYVLNMSDLFVIHGETPYNGKTVYQPNRIQIGLVGEA